MRRSEKAPRIPDLWFTIAQEAKADHGEDSWCRCFSSGAGLLAVFDGCGGLGAQRHPEYDLHSQNSCPNETEAYVASRLCAGAFYDAFHTLRVAERGISADGFFDRVNNYCARVLVGCRPDGGAKIMGSMVKTLPTTAAAALVIADERGYDICALWAGDSRVYLLNEDGLAQLTVDDATVSDPMDNLYEDGILRNVLSADRPPKLSRSTIRVKAPFLVFSATDGCFGYFSTPMEFEATLLETLQAASCAQEWEQAVQERIGQVAGDDYTLSLAAYGFGSFPALKQAFRSQVKTLRRDYLEALADLPTEDRASRQALWERYKPNYLRYIKGDV